MCVCGRVYLILCFLKFVLCPEYMTTLGTIVHTQPAGRLAVTLQWQPQFAVSGMTTQDQLFYTVCQLVEYRHCNKSRLNATTWTLLRELGIAARLPPSAAAEVGVNNNNNNEYPQWSVIDQSPSAQVTITHPRK